MLTVAASPPSVEMTDWVQDQQTEISHVPEREERKLDTSIRQERKNTKQNEIAIKLKSAKYCPHLRRVTPTVLTTVVNGATGCTQRIAVRLLIVIIIIIIVIFQLFTSFRAIFLG